MDELETDKHAVVSAVKLFLRLWGAGTWGTQSSLESCFRCGLANIHDVTLIHNMLMCLESGRPEFESIPF